jgi:hypothetical protein
MKRILILISIMFLAGCFSTFNVEKANTYLLSHPDRPDHVKEAISVGTVVQGMTEEEVTICMGKPDTITTRQSYSNNMKTTIWCYFDGAPTKRVCICFINGAVGEVNEFNQTGIQIINMNPGQVIRHHPGGTFKSEPVISPSRQNVIVSPPVIIRPPVVRKNCPR